MTQATLAEMVEKCLESAEAEVSKKLLADAAIREASRLADMYEHIKPSDYILPLDAMAGFPVESLNKVKAY
ncbi:MAG: hypothetical protein ACK5RJ_13940 [Burkholderiales bacterium]|jgi:hypothetical protein|nr:hypothetical protein [Rhodocyclaceae bacterium]MCA3018591.1 hypothetical protein [Rhodocyclaceae bacterium]MCA3022010.1 hypothetical protein [Rhodocyclaceae bacterium]MCA3024905.1 hypothetical protein [Rhodocyclaceae bacterium]MCA3032214.1 hypothetical protein [Rhodocyclaceae bacterium]